MKTSSKIIWGILIILVGVVFVLRALNVLGDWIFFPGWWTIFIFVPCLFGLFQKESFWGALWGMCFGVLFLLQAQGIVDWVQFGKIAVGVLFIVGGVWMICKGLLTNPKDMEFETINRDGKEVRVLSAKFAGQKYEYAAGELFDGVDIHVKFGAAMVNLVQAEIQENAIIKVDCKFGAVQIYVPQDVVVKKGANVSFGDIEDNRKVVPTEGRAIVLTGDCAFGAIEIK